MNTNDMIPAVQNIAKQMGVSYNDALGFLGGVQIWMGKGLPFEAAIAKHMQTMHEGIELMTKKAGA